MAETDRAYQAQWRLCLFHFIILVTLLVLNWGSPFWSQLISGKIPSSALNLEPELAFDPILRRHKIHRPSPAESSVRAGSGDGL